MKTISHLKAAHGGRLDEIYSKGTAQQLWEAWDEKQRIQFLQDHDAIINKMSTKAGFENPKRTPQQLKDVLTEFAGEKFNNLHGVIQKAITIHHAMGIYEHGGKIASTGNTVEIIKPGHHYFGKKGLVVDFILPSSIEVRFSPPEISEGYDEEFFKQKDVKIVSERRRSIPSVSTIMQKDGGRLSPAKQKIKSRIEKLTSSVEKMAGKTKEVVQKKINQLQKQLDYKPTAKERAQANQGKFAMDVPSGMSKAIYKKLWSMKIYPKIHKLNGTSSIVVDSGNNLNAAYKVYSDIADKKVPALSKISRKL